MDVVWSKRNHDLLLLFSPLERNWISSSDMGEYYLSVKTRNTNVFIPLIEHIWKISTRVNDLRYK